MNDEMYVAVLLCRVISPTSFLTLLVRTQLEKLRIGESVKEAMEEETIDERIKALMAIAKQHELQVISFLFL